MSSDLIGVPDAELGRVDEHGKFSWNPSEINELNAFHMQEGPNISTIISGNEVAQNTVYDELVRVSHSFKAKIEC